MELRSAEERAPKKRGSIKAKLILVILPIIIISIVTLLTITFQKSKNIIVNYGNKMVNSIANANSNQIETWSQDILSSLNGVKNTLDHVKFTADTQMNYLITTMSINKNFPNGVYIGTEKQDFITPDGYVPPTDYVVTERDWYKEGLTHNSFQYGAAYIDVDSGNYTVSATTILEPENGTTRVAAADIFLADISSMVESMSVLKTGISFLVDKSTNTIIAHKDSQLIASQIDENHVDPLLAESAKQIIANNSNTFNVKIKNETYIVDLEIIDNTPWVLVTYVPQSEVLGSLNQLLWFVVLLAIVAIVILTIVIERIVHIIVKPIKNLTNTIAQITTGDFSVNIETKGNDEVARMSKSMQTFIETMRGIIKEIGSMSGKLSSQAENSSNVSELLFNSAQSQSSSMGELNSTVDELARSVSEIAENATTLAMFVSETGEKGQEASQKMADTVTVSEKGRKDMEEINQSMENVERTVTSLKATVEEVGESTGKINDIVSLILEIAEETNLLSLNAAIEAARAGEAGKGFAVVADEIRKLAETSKNSVNNISELTNNINHLVSNTMTKTEESADCIKESMLLVHTASNTFGNIYSTVNKTNVLVQNMIEKVKHVDNVASTVAAITEEQSASAEEILATTESLAQHAEQVTSNSELVGKDAMELAVTAENLSKQIHIFKI